TLEAATVLRVGCHSLAISGFRVSRSLYPGYTIRFVQAGHGLDGKRLVRCPLSHIVATDPWVLLVDGANACCSLYVHPFGSIDCMGLRYPLNPGRSAFEYCVR